MRPGQLRSWRRWALVALFGCCAGLQCVPAGTPIGDPDPNGNPNPNPNDDPDPVPTGEIRWQKAFDPNGIGVLSAVWGSDSNNVYVVGGTEKGGEVYRYDGRRWNFVPIPQVPLLVWVFGFGPDDIYAVGTGGGMIHYDGLAWSNLDTGTQEDLWGIWGRSPDDMWIVGGTIARGQPELIHFDGSQFTPRTVPPNDRGASSLFKVWGVADRVFAVGERGLIIRHDADGWKQVPAGAEADDDFVSLWGVDDTNAVAVGGRSLAHVATYDGERWTTSKPSGVPGLNGVCMGHPRQAIVAGLDGYAGSFDPHTGVLTDEDSGTTQMLHAVWYDGDSRYYAVGGRFSKPYSGLALVRTLDEEAFAPLPPLFPDDACLTDAQCDSNESCVDQRCAPLPQCDQDGDCDGGQVCADGFCRPPAPECEADDDCDDDEICDEGSCVPAPECLADADCPGNLEACIDGHCVFVPECQADVDCGSHEACQDGECVFVPECDDNADCPGEREICDAGLCIFVPECDEDADCAAHESCRSGLCVFVPECDEDEDCPGQFDHCIEQVCTFLQPQCVADFDCPLQHTCDRGQCVFTNVCDDDQDCNPDETCQGGACVPTNPCVDDCVDPGDMDANGFVELDDLTLFAQALTGSLTAFSGRADMNGDADLDGRDIPLFITALLPECLATDDCPLGEFCVDGVCTPQPECQQDADCQGQRVFCLSQTCVFVPECQTSADCATHESCQAGLCVFQPECQQDDDCPGQRNFCIDQLCVFVPECDGDEDCDQFEACQQGLCIFQAQCQVDADCPGELEFCMDGLCQFIPECQQNGDCDPGEFCDAGVCRPIPPTPCQHEADCALGEACVAGFCEPTALPDVELGQSDPFQHVDQGGDFIVFAGFQGGTELYIALRTVGFTPNAQVNLVRKVTLLDNCNPEPTCNQWTDCCVLNIDSTIQRQRTLLELEPGINWLPPNLVVMFRAPAALDGREVEVSLTVTDRNTPSITASLTQRIRLVLSN